MLLRILTLLTGIAALTHWFACAWWIIGTKYIDRTPPDELAGDIHHWVLYYHGLGVDTLVSANVPIGKQ